MTRLETLLQQKQRAIASYNYVEVVRLDKLIREATEDVNLKSITDTLDDKSKHALICGMNKVFVYSKLLSVSAEDFIKQLQYRSDEAGIRSVAIVDESRAALTHLKRITNLLEENPKLKDDFDELVSSISLAVNNFIFRHEAKLLKK